MKIQMMLDIDYENNGVSKEQLKELLKDSICYLFSNGMITEDTEAEVNKFKVTFNIVQ